MAKKKVKSVASVKKEEATFELSYKGKPVRAFLGYVWDSSVPEKSVQKIPISKRNMVTQGMLELGFEVN